MTPDGTIDNQSVDGTWKLYLDYQIIGNFMYNCCLFSLSSLIIVEMQLLYESIIHMYLRYRIIKYFWNKVIQFINGMFGIQYLLI